MPASLASPLRSGKVILWALGHCAFAVKTHTRLFIFDDLTGRGPMPARLIRPENKGDRFTLVR